LAGATEQVWHERFGHANYKVIRKLANNLAVDGVQMTDKSNTNKENDRFCEEQIKKTTVFVKRAFLVSIPENRLVTQILEPKKQVHLYTLTSVDRCQSNPLVEQIIWRSLLIIILA